MRAPGLRADLVGDSRVRAAGPLRVLVVDDHRALAELLALSLRYEPDLDFVGHTGTVAEAVVMAGRCRPDVVVMDYSLPDGDGVEATRRIRLTNPGARVVMLTAVFDPLLVASAGLAGVCAFLPKSGGVQQLMNALRSATQGTMMMAPELIIDLHAAREDDRSGDLDPPLTQRERAVLDLLGAGYDARRAARQLGITVSTCRGYVKGILKKLGCHSQLEAVAAAQRLGLLRRAHGG